MNAYLLSVIGTILVSAFITAIAAAVTVYVTLLLFGNVLDADEYEMFPFGNKLSAFRRKLKRNQV